MWALVYMPILVTISTLVFTDGGWHWALHYVLFENAMSVVKTAAMVSGLLELSNAHEWGERTLFRAGSLPHGNRKVVKTGDVLLQPLYTHRALMQAVGAL